MVRSPAKSEIDHGLKKGPWTPEEDQILKDYIEKHGHGSWQSLPRRAGLNRCGKSCRLRWTNYLRPDIKRGNFSDQEVETIIDLHSTLGNKWAMIATHLPGRTDNEIKNLWNTHLRKKLLRAGIDPKTHQLITRFSLHPNFTNFPIENLANIRLLQNLLQLLNSNPLPSSSSISPMVGSDLLNLFHANGIINPTLLQLPSPLPNTDKGALSGDYDSISNSFRPPENKQQGGNSVFNMECSLPGLTPATPEISSGNIGGSSVYDCSPPIQTLDEMLASQNYERWGAAVDDEAGGSFWKDVFYESFPSSSSL